MNATHRKEPTRSQRRVIRWLLWHSDLTIAWTMSEGCRPEFPEYWAPGFGGRADVPRHVASEGTPRLTRQTFDALIDAGWLGEVTGPQKTYCPFYTRHYRPTKDGIAAIRGEAAR